MSTKKVFIIIIGVIAVSAAGWFAISDDGASEEKTRQAQFERVRDFHLKDYDGKTINLADFAGKPVVINSWAAWCPFCRKELLDFAAAQKEFNESVVIIAIDRAESREVAKKYSDELGVTDDLIFLLDPSDSFYQSIGGFSMPETIFVNGAGEIVMHKRGPMELPEIREKINQIFSRVTRF